MSDEPRLAYFVAIKEGASYLGGLLITNSLGIPIDFRYTEPITPTKLQSLLYGKALEPHLRGDVIQKALLKEIKTPPDLMFVRMSDLAGDFAVENKYPILSVQRSQEQPLPTQGATTRISSRELLVQLSEGASPLRVLFAHGLTQAEQDSAMEKVVQAGYQMDLAEPMDRTLEALRSLIHTEEKPKQG
ncbi:MAG: hypothetical protein LBQ86_07770 [Holophagales bacterium]|jgi:hypothetical protein|nr:hypothetical protein [Holophagales bacterium]